MAAPPPTSEPDYPADLVARVRGMIEKDFLPKESGFTKLIDGPTEPNSIHVFYPPLLLGYYSAFREAVLVHGAFPRKDKEILGSFVSNTNACVFCTDSHQLMAKSQGADLAEVRMAVAVNNPMALSNKSLGEIIQCITACQQKSKAEEISEKGLFSKEEGAELIGTTFIFNYINRIMDTYISREKLLPAVPGFVKFFYNNFSFAKNYLENQLVKHVFGKLKNFNTPGDSARAMDRFPNLPSGYYEWVKANEPIAQAFAYWDWSIGALADEFIPKNVTDFVGAYIWEKYDGSTPPLSRNWVFEATEDMEGSEAEKFAASFMLLVSFSRFQIDENLKQDLKKRFPDFDVCRAMAMWAAFQTAKKTAEWTGDALAQS
ncbi:hypothetical protein BSKO_07123 [Bryopsis sp. KO-2023]|nr:hypothetical protein BSKO_07123 [Bryopsis sp. KO-2023]